MTELDELERLAKAATPGFDKTLLAVRDVLDVADRDFIAAANPATSASSSKPSVGRGRG